MPLLFNKRLFCLLKKIGASCLIVHDVHNHSMFGCLFINAIGGDGGELSAPNSIDFLSGEIITYSLQKIKSQA